MNSIPKYNDYIKNIYESHLVKERRLIRICEAIKYRIIELEYEKNNRKLGVEEIDELKSLKKELNLQEKNLSNIKI